MKEKVRRRKEERVIEERSRKCIEHRKNTRKCKVEWGEVKNERQREERNGKRGN